MDITVTTRQCKLPLSLTSARQAIARMLKAAGAPQAELSIVFVNGRTMRAVNRQFLGHDYVTDVVTFDLASPKAKRLEGEIFICPAEARRNARLYRQPVQRELLRYVAHGILHLRGFNDVSAAQRELMRRKEDELLNAL